ncbi:hypothetical protein SAMD00019534_061370 [Acytostelium subglobosum LB1]|uniref:hypothetical protein n=1 Tax=Acytostelium subglobosum LB1 TaxID=1410327 RepID=UPI0006450005|nr:hypothetical protein SAMD00019534_061370 [Acytostelium subglobosum LB1]GAM22962.1 hypothetical protein SAMD00019534_061370 [Acytostelium subglobosum LB1]|eukprot:XP_012754189.1 hypothetical protein SAMD00019534_061370 [Acytostelium subglobosum LB1]
MSLRYRRVSLPSQLTKSILNVLKTALFETLSGGLIMSDPPPGMTEAIYPPNSLPHSLTILAMGDYFDEMIPVGMLPQSLTELRFGTHYNKPIIMPGVLPHSITSITYGTHYDHPVIPGTMPRSLMSLEFGSDFNQSMIDSRSIGTLPSMISLTFGGYFNRSLDLHDLPRSLQSLTFGDGFDQLLSPGILPDSITSLTFGYCFSQPLQPGVLPTSLHTLRLGGDFNHPVPPCTSLTSLTFGFSFNQVLMGMPGQFPLLLTLEFGDAFNQQLAPGQLPLTLTTLKLGYGFRQKVTPEWLPVSLTDLTIRRMIEPHNSIIFPQRLKSLSIPSVEYLNIYVEQMTAEHSVDTIWIGDTIHEFQLAPSSIRLKSLYISSSSGANNRTDEDNIKYIKQIDNCLPNVETIHLRIIRYEFGHDGYPISSRIVYKKGCIIKTDQPNKSDTFKLTLIGP